MSSNGSSRVSRSTSRRRLTALFVCAGLCLLVAAIAPVRAQLATARLSGTIVDEEGNPIEGVSLTMSVSTIHPHTMYRTILIFSDSFRRRPKA